MVITRLRIGHTRLTSQYMLRGENQPVCENCRLPLTVKHILEECRKYSQIFSRHNLPRNIKELLSANPVINRKLIELCKEANLYNSF